MNEAANHSKIEEQSDFKHDLYSGSRDRAQFDC